MLLDENIPDLPSEQEEPPTERETLLDSVWDLVEEEILEAKAISTSVNAIEDLFDDLLVELWNKYLRFYKV